MKKYVQIMLNCTFLSPSFEHVWHCQTPHLQNFAQKWGHVPYAHVLKLIGFDVYLVIIPIS